MNKYTQGKLVINILLIFFLAPQILIELTSSLRAENILQQIYFSISNLTFCVIFIGIAFGLNKIFTILENEGFKGQLISSVVKTSEPICKFRDNIK